MNSLTALIPMPKYDITVDLSKRNFMKAGGVAAAGTLMLGAKGCGIDVDTWVRTILGGLETLKSYLPAQEALITKAISVAKVFNEAWKGGKFTDATALFENLSNVINEFITAAGIDLSQEVKIIIVVIDGALTAIALFMKKEANDPAIAAAVNAKTAADPNAARQRALIEKMANPRAIDALFAASRP